VVLRGLLRGCGIRTKLIIAARCESVCSLHELQKGMSLLGKRHALHHVRAWSFGLSSQDSSRLLVSCVSYRFFPRFFLGLVFCGFLLILSELRATNADCTLLRKIRRFPSNTR